MSERQQAMQQERQAVRRRMAIHQGVDEFTNELVRRVRALVDDSKVAETRMEKHQIGNVLAVALETPSVELLKVFVLYQAGRDVRRDNWRRNDFGEELVKELDGLRQPARAIAEQVSRQLSAGQAGEEDVDEVWVALARQYLGQLNRYFYYCKEAARWSR